MKLRLIKIGLILASIIGLALWLSHKNKPQVINGPAVIGNNGDTLIIHQPGHPDANVYQPQPNTTVISTDPHGNVTVTVKHFGIGFDPGIGVSYVEKLRLALDARVLFYNRFGLNTGLAFSLSNNYTLGDVVKPFAAISYALPFNKFSNTSVYAGVTLDKFIIGGVRVRL